MGKIDFGIIIDTSEVEEKIKKIEEFIEGVKLSKVLDYQELGVNLTPDLTLKNIEDFNFEYHVSLDAEIIFKL